MMYPKYRVWNDIKYENWKVSEKRSFFSPWIAVKSFSYPSTFTREAILEAYIKAKTCQQLLIDLAQSTK